MLAATAVVEHIRWLRNLLVVMTITCVASNDPDKDICVCLKRCLWVANKMVNVILTLI